MRKAAALFFGVGLLVASHADAVKLGVQYVSAAQLEAKVAHTVDGMVNQEVPSGPGSTILIIRREKDGEVEVHKVMNDVILIKSGHAKFLVGGEVRGNRETKPTEWRGGDITAATIKIPLQPAAP